MLNSVEDALLEKKRLEIQEKEYVLPYHYTDVFARGQSVERNSVFNLVVETLLRAGKGHVIDAGCGDGRFCYFAKHYVRIEGLDISERALVWARAFNPEITFHNKRIENLDAHCAFDGAVSLEVLEHIPDDNISTFIGGIKSVVTDDAVVIFAVPSIKKPLEEKHFRHYTESSLRGALGPFFREVTIVGHSRVNSLHRKIFSAMNVISLISYSDHFCWKYPRVIDFISKTKERYWQRHLHIGRPDDCHRLIAICRA
jgi:cyclopropane fatty-acyl-phospholipid synthase-like methyltransferase